MASEIKLKSIKTIRGRRFYKKKCPLLNENDKNTLIINNGRLKLSKQFLADMKLIKSPLAMSYEICEHVSVFEETKELEKLFEKFNSSLFIMGTHSKKRPNNIIFGRAFDNQILDMYEFEIENYLPMSANKVDKFSMGSKPILIFTGFPNDSDHMENFYLKTLLIDMFRGPKVKNINRSGLDYCIHFQSLEDNRVNMSVCKLITKLDNGYREVTDVIDLGATATLKLRRHQLPDEQTWKKALKKPDVIKPKKQKNIEKDIFGNVFGRVHLGREDNDKLGQLVADKYHRRLRKSKSDQRQQDESEPMEIVE